MNIAINPYDKKSIDAALKLVQKYRKDFETKEAEFVQRLAEVGVSVAIAGFSMAEYDGKNDVMVSMEKTDSGYRVVASGETVGFIEFGTGRPERNPEWSGTDLNYTPPPRGSYGKQQGLNPWGWWFKVGEGVKAKHTYGNPPAEAMLTARNQMIEQVTRIAREVWK